MKLKKRRITIIVLAVLFVLLLAAYIIFVQPLVSELIDSSVKLDLLGFFNRLFGLSGFNKSYNLKSRCIEMFKISCHLQCRSVNIRYFNSYLCYIKLRREVC